LACLRKTSRHASGLFNHGKRRKDTRLTPPQVGFGSKSSKPRTNAIRKLAKMSSNPIVVHTKSDILGDSIFRFIEASIEVFSLSSRPVAETCSTLDLRRRSQKSFSQGTAINIGPVAPKKSLSASHKEYVIQLKTTRWMCAAFRVRHSMRPRPESCRR
jgi:hypothetical protein